MKGIYQGISNKEYHADIHCYSSSIIKMMDVPALARHELMKHAEERPKEYKDCYRIGTAIHMWLLERDRFHENFLIGIKAGRRSNAEKAEWAEWFTEHGATGWKIIDRPAAQWHAAFEAETGKWMVTPKESQLISDMAESVAAKSNAIELLEGGDAEQSCYWKDDETGLNLRCRPDYMNADFISDLKSIESVRDKAITNAIEKFGYLISQAMYQDGVYQVTGDWRQFCFIFVDKKPPHLCRVISVDYDAAESGLRKYRERLTRLRECLDADEWPGIDDNLNYTLPKWAL